MSNPTIQEPLPPNDLMFLLVGKATAGKSMALRGLRDPEGVLYLNAEGKKLPFKSKFKEVVITDPYQIHGIFEQLLTNDKYHTVVIDSVTYLMEMYETLHIYKSADTRAAWQHFQQYFKKLMHYYIPLAKRKVIFTAHTMDTINGDSIKETGVPIKGALKNNGIESYFSCIVAAKRMKVADLEEYNTPLLTINDNEKRLRFKHVLQTQLTEDTVYEKLRSPYDLFTYDETFVNGDAQIIMDRLSEYYTPTDQ